MEVAGSEAGAGFASERWRQRGEAPWASARMRCFIVGAGPSAWDQGRTDVAGAVVSGALSLLRVVSGLGVRPRRRSW
ncbi:hypothetical protein SHIRM173S_09661 [Streptomyces hirsutus]